MSESSRAIKEDLTSMSMEKNKYTHIAKQLLKMEF